MSLFHLLSEEDKSLMKDWISYYGISNRERNDYPHYRANLEHALRDWATQKETLWQLFGEQFIIEREVTYNRPAELLHSDLEDALNDSDSGMYRFREYLLEKLENVFNYWSEEHRAIRRLFSIESLSKNRYMDRSAQITIGDKRFDLCYNSTKPLKVLNKLAKEFDLVAEYEDFRIQHSQILNQKVLKGTLCLSIHPFDFMTLSDNSYDWDSCMNWENNGCYRTGTIEMMNSPYMLVAYLKGSEPFRVNTHYWSGNKKWRELVVVHPHAITNIKGYPYKNEVLSLMVLEWVRELVGVNLGWDVSYDPQPYEVCDTFHYADGRDYSYDFETYRMYNDFGTGNTCHNIIIPQGWQSDYDSSLIRQRIDISGANTCICCGAHWDPWEGHECAVLCTECDPGPTCDHCGGNLDEEEDNIYYVEGDTLCECCFDAYAGRCGLSEEYFYSENLVDIVLAPLDNDLREVDNLRVAQIHRDYVDDFCYYSSWFHGLEKPRIHVTEDGETYYYVNMSECTNRALDNLFGLWSDWIRRAYVDEYVDALERAGHTVD